MENKINHRYFFLQALRTALIFISGFLTYELLKIVENNWNKKYPNNELSNYVHRTKHHFLIIFIVDLLILYSVVFLFDIRL